MRPCSARGTRRCHVHSRSLPRPSAAMRWRVRHTCACAGGGTPLYMQRLPPRAAAFRAACAHASSQFGGAMHVSRYDTSAISVSISNGTTFASCSAVAGGYTAVRTRHAPRSGPSPAGRGWLAIWGWRWGGSARVAGGAGVRVRRRRRAQGEAMSWPQCGIVRLRSRLRAREEARACSSRAARMRAVRG